MKLDAYLEKTKLKPTQFARSLNVSASQITRLLRGERGISLDLALKIERETSGDVRPSDLVVEIAVATPAAEAVPA